MNGIVNPGALPQIDTLNSNFTMTVYSPQRAGGIQNTLPFNGAATLGIGYFINFLSTSFVNLTVSNDLFVGNNATIENDLHITSGGLFTNTIDEETVGSGVTVGGVLCQDGAVRMARNTVTQLTSISTAVTLNAPVGVITTVSSTLAAGTSTSFTLNNSFIVSSSVIQVTMNYQGVIPNDGLPILFIDTPSTGSVVITIMNINALTALNNTMKIHFSIL